MATILRGKRKGEDVKIHQWSNDWFLLKDCTTISPTSLRLTPEEVQRVRESAYNGIMFRLYTLSDGGVFKRIKR